MLVIMKGLTVNSSPNKLVPNANLTLALTLSPDPKPNPNPNSNPNLNLNELTWRRADCHSYETPRIIQ